MVSTNNIIAAPIIQVLVDEVDTEEMQDETAKYIVCECSVTKLVVIICSLPSLSTYLSGDTDANSPLFSVLVCIRNEAMRMLSSEFHM